MAEGVGPPSGPNVLARCRSAPAGTGRRRGHLRVLPDPPTSNRAGLILIARLLSRPCRSASSPG